MTARYKLYGRLEQENDGGYLEFLSNGIPNDAVTVGSQMGNLRVAARSGGTAASEIILKDVKAYTDEDIVRDYILSRDYKSAILGTQAQNAVTGNLTVPSVHYGATVSLNITNSGGELFDAAGKLTAALAPGESRDAALTPMVRFTNKLGNLEIPYPSFGITVKGIAKSILYKKTVTLSGAAADGGSDKACVNDGFFDTAFVTGGSESAFSLTFDLSKAALFNKLDLYEGILGGNYNVADWVFEASNNKSLWAELAKGSRIGAEKSVITNPPYIEYRYVRLTVSNKLTPDAKAALSEITLDFDPDDDYKNQKDFETVKAPPSGVSADFYVQGTGTVYGNAVKWESLDISVLSVSQTLENGQYKIICIRPAQSKDITVKASIGRESKNFTVRVSGTSGATGSGGGGSSSGGGGGGGAVVFVPSANPGDGTGTDLENTGPTPKPPSKYFNDMNSAAWAGEYVDALKEKGIVAGNGNGGFEPNGFVTREQFTKMLVLSLNIELIYDYGIPFNDVPRDGWAYPYIAAAYKNGLINGMSADMFGPGENISRQDIAALIARAVDAAGKVPVETVSGKFNDEGEISGYAVEAVLTLSELGVLNGDENGNFRPKSNASRAESAKILYMLLSID
jgi:uncharacterized membrane protein YgcG